MESFRSTGTCFCAWAKELQKNAMRSNVKFFLLFAIFYYFGYGWFPISKDKVQYIKKRIRPQYLCIINDKEVCA